MNILNKRYRIIHPLGKGGMGIVYKATDALLGDRFVALKGMGQQDVDPQDLAYAIAAFKREALMLASLSHPNLPRIYDYFEENGKAYLVMDFIEGETLANLLHRTPGKRLGIEEVLSIAEQLCSAVAYLHGRRPPIIFRDIKPSNIMITSRECHLYLIDFGIARFFKPRQSKDTRYQGTVGYAAPEQYYAQTSTSSDIYSLGVTLHELLTGLDPTKARMPLQFPSIREYNPQAPLALDELIRQMLALHPSRRPVRVTDIKQQLQQFHQQLQSTAHIQTPGTLDKQTLPFPGSQTLTTLGIETTKKMRAILWPFAAQSRRGATLCVYCQHSASIYTVAWSPDGKYIASGSKDKTVQIWDASTGKKTLTYGGHTRDVYSVAWSPLPFGDRIASASFGTVHIWSAISGECFLQYDEHSSWVYAAAWSSAGFAMASGGADRKVSLWDTRKGEVMFRYPDLPGIVRAVAWSNDTHAKKLLVGCEDALLYCWEMTAQRRPLIYRGHKEAVTCVAWSPDGQKCVSGSRDKTVKIWDISTGHTLSTYQGHTMEVYAVAWSPDGTRIASAGRDRSVHIWDASTGKTLSTYQGHTMEVYAVAWSPDGTHIASASADKTMHVWRQAGS
jgi:WD40 repeat protein/predicted Ser/Thr protein kinase